MKNTLTAEQTVLLNKQKLQKVKLKVYRCDAIKAAKDLNYGDQVIWKLKYAKSMDEITRIMKTARNAT